VIDRREQILVRLLAILTTLIETEPQAVVSVVRNRELRKDEERPGIVLLDGDETPALTGRALPGRATGMSAQLMTMSPQVFILMNEQRPTRDTIGTATNAIRGAIIGLVANDATLKSLYGPNGSIELSDVTTDMKSGGEVRGSMMMDLRITYPLVP
jgi:hypothetical protein